MSSLTPSEVTDVTVVGAGTMGHGIAQVFATSGYEVTLVDVEERPLEAAVSNVRTSLERLGEDPDEVLDRIETTTDRESGLAGADVMVEAVPEALEIKEDVFETADEILPERAVLATNTSTLPITEIAAATDRPERVVGMHFSNPVPLIDVVELIRGERTDDATFAFAEALSEAVGKTPVLVEKDVPGFLLNRINYAFWSEALRALDEGDRDPEAVDASIRRLGFPMGPFEVLDFAGIDVFHMACRAMQSRGVPVVVSDRHEELVEAGNYGMKTGEGFYEYSEPGAYERVSIPRERRYEYDPYPTIASAVNAAAWLIDNDVTTKEDVDTAMETGMSWPRGPLKFADEYGIDRTVETLERLYGETGRDQYDPHPLLERMVSRGALGTKAGEGFYEYAHERRTVETVEYERRSELAVVTLPDQAGGYLEPATWRGLRAALERAAEDDGVRATVLGAEGRGFAADEGIAGTLREAAADDGTAAVEDVVLGTVRALRDHPKPTVARVEGDATGAGCELVLLSDVAVAAEDAEFAQPEATTGGLAPIWIACGVASVGKKKLLELATTGDPISASEAADAGLVNYAVPGGQATDVARELARATVENDPESIEAIERLWAGIEADLVDSWIERAGEEVTDLVGRRS